VRRFFTLGWLGLHAVAIVLATSFLGFGWWQLQRAEDGNMRSWGYAFEWPLFAVFVIVMWVKMMYDDLHDTGEDGEDGGAGRPVGSDGAPRVPVHVAAQDFQNGEDDPELAAYNRYLARLDDEAGRYR
jgi:DNA-binding transcriptional regulator of glucitol operon